MEIAITYHEVGQQRLVVRPGKLRMLYVPTDDVIEHAVNAAWAYYQLGEEEFLMNKLRNMTNHEIAREVLEKTDDFFDGEGLKFLRVPA